MREAGVALTLETTVHRKVVLVLHPHHFGRTRRHRLLNQTASLLEVLQLDQQFLVHALQVLNHAFLLSVLVHQLYGLFFQRLVDRHVQTAVGQTVQLLVLRKQVVLHLGESLVADFLQLAAELVVLLLDFLDVLVLEGDRALLVDELFLFFVQLLFEVKGQSFDLLFLQCDLVLLIPDLLVDLLHIRLVVKLLVRRLKLVFQLNNFCLRLDSECLKFSLDLGDSDLLLCQLRGQLKDLLLILFGVQAFSDA